MHFQTLDEWLDWQLQLHNKSIDLGLERVSEVANRLQIGAIAKKVITVAGTNGKGSTVAYYENWLNRAGYSVASYTSPHLLRYNERIKLDLVMVADVALCRAFEAVERARKNTALTYFEYGTLAAFWLIQRHAPDYAILEVGLGGRLDAVNIIDADLTHLTSIGIDHQGWLGDNREKIGFEKAGILRKGVPVVCNDSQPPQSVLDEIDRLKCPCLQFQRDFDIKESAQTGKYDWFSRELEFRLTPPLGGSHQLQNLAGVVAGLGMMLPLGEYESSVVAHNFNGTELMGRFQHLPAVQETKVYIDVGHNPDAAKVLAANLSELKLSSSRIVVLLGMLEDKEVGRFVSKFEDVVDDWWLLSLDCDRGLSADALAGRMGSNAKGGKKFSSVETAINHALSSLSFQDIILVTGSFVTVELFLQALSKIQSN